MLAKIFFHDPPLHHPITEDQDMSADDPMAIYERCPRCLRMPGPGHGETEACVPWVPPAPPVYARTAMTIREMMAMSAMQGLPASSLHEKVLSVKEPDEAVAILMGSAVQFADKLLDCLAATPAKEESP